MAGKLAASSRVDIARAGVGMAIHPMATKPDISSLDTLKGALITARSITYVEQGATASILRSIFAKLGTHRADEREDRVVRQRRPCGRGEEGGTRLHADQRDPERARRRRWPAPLPPEVQVYTTFAAAISTGSAPPMRRGASSRSSAARRRPM